VIFTPTPLDGAWIVDLERRGDARGFFARTFCAREFAAHGLASGFVQGNMSLSARPGTIRGLHVQRAPHAEAKLVRCMQGAMWDVIVDARPASPTYLRSFGVELTPGNGRALYVPAGFAHGFQTLEPDTIAFYMVDEYYAPDAEDGFAHDDPALGIDWPLAATEISDKDRAWPRVAGRPGTGSTKDRTPR
jgi:dTDP-4-dehydrorhamnose 3,5-epimerase